MKICFDLDGTLCTKTNGKYHLARPIKKAIEKANQYFDEGNYIIIFTARYMGRNNGNIKKAYKQGFDEAKEQLKKWGIKYNELIFGKPEFDILIDDKSFDYNKSWYK